MVFLPAFFIMMILSLPLLVILQPAKLFMSRIEKERRVARFLSRWAKVCLFIAGVNVELKGHMPQGDSIVIFSNHQSYFDILVLLAGLTKPVAFVAKRSLKNVPILGQWISESGGVFVSRQKTKNELKNVQQIVRKLKEGTNFVIFPEGTRSKNGHLGHFRRGSFKIPVMANSKSVVVAIKGSYIINPKGSLLITPGKVEVSISGALEPQEEIGEKVRGFIEKETEGIDPERPLRRLEYAPKG